MSPVYIRTKEEALDAVASVLGLPERRDQIIRCTVAIMQCLQAEPREFLADCQAMLIEDGLEGLKRKRREVLDHLQEHDVVAVLDPDENRQLETIASALDAVRFSDIVHEVFPNVADRYQPWEIARAMLASEAPLQEGVLTALRVRNGSAGPDDHAAAADKVDTLIRTALPSWRSRAGEIRRSCAAVVTDAEESERVFWAIVTSDDRAVPFLQAVDRDPSSAVEIVRHLRELTNALRALDGARKPSK